MISGLKCRAFTWVQLCVNRWPIVKHAGYTVNLKGNKWQCQCHFFIVVCPATAYFSHLWILWHMNIWNIMCCKIQWKCKDEPSNTASRGNSNPQQLFFGHMGARETSCEHNDILSIFNLIWQILTLWAHFWSSLTPEKIYINACDCICFHYYH